MHCREALKEYSDVVCAFALLGLHRVGRTGRFGTYGICVAFVNKQELTNLQAFMEESSGKLAEPLPDPVPKDWYTYQLKDAEEEMAFERLLQAPVVPEPLRHFQDEPEHWVDPMQSATDGPPLDWWRDWMGMRDDIWNTWDPYEFDAKSFQDTSACDLDSVVYSEECFPTGQLLWSRDADGSVVSDPVDLIEEAQDENCEESTGSETISAHSTCPSPLPGISESPEQRGEKEHRPSDFEALSIGPVAMDTTNMAHPSFVATDSIAIGNSGAKTACLERKDGHSPVGLESSVHLVEPPLPVDCSVPQAQSQPSAPLSPWVQHSQWLQMCSHWQAAQSENLNTWYAAYRDWHTQYSQWCAMYIDAQVLTNNKKSGICNKAQSDRQPEESKAE